MLSEEELLEEFNKYLQSVKEKNSHQAKILVFHHLLESFFDTDVYETAPDVEKYIKTGSALKLKGRLDLRLGRTIIEFKTDFPKELTKALEEIERYSKILQNKKQKIATCIITDGLRFKVYVIIQNKPVEIRDVNFSNFSPEQALQFLDTFLLKERIAPTAENLNARFGTESPIFTTVTTSLRRLCGSVNDTVKFRLWSRSMEVVYGTAPLDDAFISQTYLMILVRLLIGRYLVQKDHQYIEILNGRLFEKQGITIIEEDFFSWVLNPNIQPQIKNLIGVISEALDCYDLESVNEDIFKEIYQDIIKKGDRHRLGEYYTPEWLAELTLLEAINQYKKQGKSPKSFLDPACGSGTFLTNSIHYLKKQGCNLNQILTNVCGIDFNPLAVMIARANYLLALGDLLLTKKEPIFIPVFMADSLILPKALRTIDRGIDVLSFPVEIIERKKQNSKLKSAKSRIERTILNIPLDIVLNESELKNLLDGYYNIISEYKGKKITKDKAISIFKRRSKYESKTLELLLETLETLLRLIDENKDSIWIFMFRNIYAPLRMRARQFDVVVGNPPWVAFRYIENPSYKDFIKTEVFKYELLKSNETDLFTQMDTSTIFYSKSADIYLKDKGVLAFIMPRSVITGAKQHKTFKLQKKPVMKILNIIDVEKVNPLFNVNACSIIAKKNGGTNYPVPLEIISGELPNKNLKLIKAKEFLKINKTEYSPPKITDYKSPYHDRILAGANIYPRTLWFVKFRIGKYGFNPEIPAIDSLVLSDAKEPWKSTILEGEVEKDFIFSTMTGKSILPFKPQFLPIVLPLELSRGKIRILSSGNLRSSGTFNMADWLDKAQNAWESKATKGNLQNFKNLMNYVNYHNKLIQQKQNLQYYLIYTTSGTNLASAVVDLKKIPHFRIDGIDVKSNGFIADYTTYWYGSKSEAEAYYLCSILNSNVLNKKIKPHQTRGQWGPRHICRLPFEFNIPAFNPENETHIQLGILGKKATKEAMKLQVKSRDKIKQSISHIKQIDLLVDELFKNSNE
ncbi:MAG: N-6 DNA methylase [Methanoregula sp.]|jgi:type I restriction-modification system DNA methylase subunit